MQFSFVNILLVGIAVAFFGFMAYWFYVSMTIDDTSAKKIKSPNVSTNQPKNSSDNANKKNRKTA